MKCKQRDQKPGDWCESVTAHCNTGSWIRAMCPPANVQLIGFLYTSRYILSPGPHNHSTFMVLNLEKINDFLRLKQPVNLRVRTQKQVLTSITVHHNLCQTTKRILSFLPSFVTFHQTWCLAWGIKWFQNQYSFKIFSTEDGPNPYQFINS
jgi:hypothetical protein